MNNRETADLLPAVNSSLPTPATQCIKPLHPSHTSSATSELLFFILPLFLEPHANVRSRACVFTVPPLVNQRKNQKRPHHSQVMNKSGHEVSHRPPYDSTRFPIRPTSRSTGAWGEECVSLLIGGCAVSFADLSSFSSRLFRPDKHDTREDTLARHARASIVF
jgi:hypothetical protein